MKIRKYVVGIVVILLLSIATAVALNRDSYPQGYLYPAPVGDRWGYIDQTGRMVIKPQFSAASGFDEDGYAAVSLPTEDPSKIAAAGSGPFAIIDRRGRIVVGPDDGFARLGRGRWIVWEGDHPRYVGLIEPFSSTIQCSGALGPFQEGLVAVEIGEKYGFMDEGGELAIPPIFSDNGTSGFHEGLAVGRNEIGWGYIDHSGTWRIEPQFDSASRFSEGLAVVRKAKRDFYIDASGKRAIARDFERAFYFNEGLAAAYEIGSRLGGYIDKSGQTRILARFRMVNSFREGLALVEDDKGQAGYIDHSGQFVIKLPSFPQGLLGGDFHNGRAFVRLEDGKSGYIDRRGNWIWSHTESRVASK